MKNLQVEMPEEPCLFCGQKQDRMTAIDGNDPSKGPAPGDYGICWNCGNLSVLDQELDRRKPTKEELEKAHSDRDITVALIRLRIDILSRG